MHKPVQAIPKDQLFVLDIGTRNVVGSIARMKEEVYEVIDYEIREHPDRAMVDGQIHDIDKVSRVVGGIVSALESRQSVKLDRVAIAAAGRALITQRTAVTREMDLAEPISRAQIDSVVLEGIQRAQTALEKSQKKRAQYYCVGYSVINYYLDDAMILNAKGHRGSELRVDLIATFLPHLVVDSLYSVVEAAGLEVVNLTLEPIAAMNVAIPQNLRLLNLALVDVGAGTSDIAITRDGTVVSYGMVDKAGDEMTEVLARSLLLDFDGADRLKRTLSGQQSVRYTDVLGFEHEATTESIVAMLEEPMEMITDEIAATVNLINGGRPSAIFCIGGGCQVPGFTERLAGKLDLPAERVVIKGAEMLDGVLFHTEPLKGPEYITPLGIGVNAFREIESDFIQVSVNGQVTRLFNAGRLTVKDALVLVGFNPRNLLPKRGQDLSYFVNGEERRLKGFYGEAAVITVNGVLGNLDTPIKHRDVIAVEDATDGGIRRTTLGELFGFNERLYIDGRKISRLEYMMVNGEFADPDHVVRDGDRIDLRMIDRVADLERALDIDLGAFQILVNNREVAEDHVLRNGDQIRLAQVSRQKTHVAEEDKRVEKAAGPSRWVFLVNGRTVTVETEKERMIFVDIFDHIDFDRSEAKGILELKLNGQRAQFVDPLASGDEIEIRWRA